MLPRCQQRRSHGTRKRHPRSSSWLRHSDEKLAAALIMINTTKGKSFQLQRRRSREPKGHWTCSGRDGRRLTTNLGWSVSDRRLDQFRSGASGQGAQDVAEEVATCRSGDIERLYTGNHPDLRLDGGRRTLARGNFRGGLKISKESDICPNALAIEGAFEKELRMRSASEIARYAMKASSAPTDSRWTSAIEPTTLKHHGVGNGRRASPRPILHDGQFVNAFGVGRDLPVFECAH